MTKEQILISEFEVIKNEISNIISNQKYSKQRQKLLNEKFSLAESKIKEFKNL